MANEAADQAQIIAQKVRAVASFTGREAELAAIDMALWQQGGRAALTTEGAASDGADAASTSLRGLGGVGKSVIAQEYAWRNRERYAGVWWVRGETRETLLNDIVELGARLMPGLDETPDRADAAAATLDAITQMHAGKPWLVVYDNVGRPDDIARLTPAANAHALITSHWSGWNGEAQEVAIGVFPRPTAVEYLLERTRQPDAHAAGRLADALGCLPLALALARATCWTMGLGFDAYREKLPDLIGRAPHGASYPAPLFATVDLALETALARRPQAATLLGIAAYLAPDRIPLDIVTADVMSETERGKAVAALGEVSLAELATLDDGTPTISVHPLVQETMKGRLAAGEMASSPLAGEVARRAGGGELLAGGSPQGSREQQARSTPTPSPSPQGEGEYAVLATRLMAEAYPREPDDVGSWLRCRLLEPHVDAVLTVAPDEGGAADSTLRLINEHARYLTARGELGSAEPLHTRALAIVEHLHGPEHPIVASHLNTLASLLAETNRLAEAEPLLRRALAIDEKANGPEHPDVATGLNDLAHLLQRTDRPTEAEPLLRRAIAIDEKGLGPDHPAVARDLNNLAHVLKATNRLAEAEPPMRRALDIDERHYGPGHPNVGVRLDNLAQLLQDAGCLGEAEPLLRRALDIFETTLGPEHASVAATLNMLAALLRATNRPAEAEPLMRRALAIDERVYGPEHPALANDLDNLALLLRDTSHAADAEPLMRRAMHILEASLGPDHPRSKSARANHAAIMQVVKALQDRLDADEVKRLGKYKAAHASPYPVTHIPVPEASATADRPGFFARMLGRR